MDPDRPRDSRALVIGAGIGGMTAAVVLARHFDEVTILESDSLPQGAKFRAGVPQGRHVHGLLAGGLLTLEELLPGFRSALEAAGAIPVRAGLDARLEQPDHDPFPQRDLGFTGLSMTRPLLEHVVRQEVLRADRIRIRENCRVRELWTDNAGDSVAGIGLEQRGGAEERLPADLVVDASGRGVLTLEFLARYGYEPSRESSIDIDVRYTCGIFVLPPDPARDWKVLMTRPDPRVNGRRAIMFPIEGEGRFLLGLGGVGGDSAPADLPGFLEFAKSLRTPTAYRAIAQATLEGPLVRFAFPQSMRRHFEGMSRFPRRLIPIGDAVCRINPSFGQGMTVAAQEAKLLHTLLAASGGDRLLDTLASRFLAALPSVLDVPWATATQDYVYPHLEGVRPADFGSRTAFQEGLNRLAAKDASIHQLTWEVGNLLRPPSVLREPAIAARVEREAL